MNFDPDADIDLAPYLSDFAALTHSPEYGSSSTYRLYAVSNHMGSLGGGHYTAYAKVEEMWCVRVQRDRICRQPNCRRCCCCCVGCTLLLCIVLYCTVSVCHISHCWLDGCMCTRVAGRWWTSCDRYCFDDSRVSPVKASAIASAEAYVLYFQMVDGDPPPATAVVQRPPPSESSEDEDADDSDDSDEDDERGGRGQVAAPPVRRSRADDSSSEEEDSSSTGDDEV